MSKREISNNSLAMIATVALVGILASAIGFFSPDYCTCGIKHAKHKGAGCIRLKYCVRRCCMNTILDANVLSYSSINI